MATINKSKAKKGQTIKGTTNSDWIYGSKYADKIYSNGGQDVIFGGKGNDKIYMKKTEHNTSDLVFYKGDGKDTIYNAKSYNTNIWYDDMNYSDSYKISLTKSGKNLVIKRSDSKNDSITLSNYFSKNTPIDDNVYRIRFGGSDYYFGYDSSRIQVSGSGTIQGTYMYDYIKGSKKADKMYGYYGDDIYYGGKGNDKIYTPGDGDDAVILIGKGNGNDTIMHNSNTDDIDLIFNNSPNFTYTKKGKDLVITATHAKVGKEKTAVKENVTVKNYFNQYGDVNKRYVYVYTSNASNLAKLKTEDAIYNTTISSDNLRYILQDAPLIQKGNAKKNNYFIGTDFNDVIYCGNKSNTIYDTEGNNTFYTGTSGKAFIYGGEGDDKYVVKSIKTSTVIADYGSRYKGDTLQINSANANDLFLYMDVNSSGNIINIPEYGLNYNSTKYNMGTRGALYFMTGSELLSNLKKNATANTAVFNIINKKKLGDVGPYPNANVTFTSSVAGVSLINYFNHSEYNNGLIENITLANSKGGNAQTLAGGGEALEYVISQIKNEVSNYLSYEGFSDTQAMLKDIKKTLGTKITKNMSKSKKKSIQAAQKEANRKLNNLVNIYKTYNLGTDGNDTYTNISAKNITLQDGYKHRFAQTICSGKGNDTFKFAKNFGEVQIYAESNTKGLMPTETDKLVFSNYAFEEGTLAISFNHNFSTHENEIRLGAFSKNIFENGELGNCVGAVEYRGFFRDGDGDNALSVTLANAKNLQIQDKKRTYDVTYVGQSFPVNLSNSFSNNIIYAESNLNFTSSRGFNRVVAYNDDKTNTITYGGGHDVYNMQGDSDDTYNILFNNDTSVVIYDAGNYDNGDTLNINGIYRDMVLFFKVDGDGDAVKYGDLYIMNKSKINSSSVQNITNPSGAIVINDYFTDWDSNGNMENINIIDANSSDSSCNYNGFKGWINYVKSNVASWLDSHAAYSTVTEVLESGKQNDINSLLAIYKSCDLASYYNMD